MFKENWKWSILLFLRFFVGEGESCEVVIWLWFFFQGQLHQWIYDHTTDPFLVALGEQGLMPPNVKPVEWSLGLIRTLVKPSCFADPQVITFHTGKSPCELPTLIRNWLYLRESVKVLSDLVVKVLEGFYLELLRWIKLISISHFPLTLKKPRNRYIHRIHVPNVPRVFWVWLFFSDYFLVVPLFHVLVEKL